MSDMESFHHSQKKNLHDFQQSPHNRLHVVYLFVNSSSPKGSPHNLQGKSSMQRITSKWSACQGFHHPCSTTYTVEFETCWIIPRAFLHTKFHLDNLSTGRRIVSNLVRPPFLTLMETRTDRCLCGHLNIFLLS